MPQLKSRKFDHLWLFPCVLIFVLLDSCSVNEAVYPFLNTELSIEQRVDDLVSRMTLEEKIGQMTLFTTDWGSTGPTIREGFEEDIRKGRCGALFNSHTVAFTRRLQEIAVKERSPGLCFPGSTAYDQICFGGKSDPGTWRGAWCAASYAHGYRACDPRCFSKGNHLSRSVEKI